MLGFTLPNKPLPYERLSGDRHFYLDFIKWQTRKEGRSIARKYFPVVVSREFHEIFSTLRPALDARAPASRIFAFRFGFFRRGISYARGYLISSGFRCPFFDVRAPRGFTTLFLRMLLIFMPSQHALLSLGHLPNLLNFSTLDRTLAHDFYGFLPSNNFQIEYY